jgi:lipopolysaccharide/colanic/teichoic acid biosynthesis glycosyltransferase
MNFFRRATKRAIDVGIALASVPVAVPISVVVGALTVVESRGHPIFTQTRVGKDGRLFRVYKLRTMIPDAENLGAGIYAEKNDPRYTKVGIFARRLSLDELPQLLNVLKGDMSIVGPRPQLPLIVDANAKDYRDILAVRPGLTGLAQVSGRNALPRSQRIRLDRQYAQGWTIRGDLGILIKTLRVVLVGEGQMNDGAREEVER